MSLLHRKGEISCLFSRIVVAIVVGFKRTETSEG